jgi:hypothetical protein
MMPSRHITIVPISIRKVKYALLRIGTIRESKVLLGVEVAQSLH